MINTDDILLRHIQMSDLQDMYEYAKDEDTGPRAGWPPHTNIEITKEILTKMCSPENTEETFAIIYRPDNKMIGTIGITHLNIHQKDTNNLIVKDYLNNNKQTYEIGLTISKTYWGKGIGTKVIKAMLRYIFEIKKADIAVALHYEENYASGKIQEKNNLKILGSYTRDKKWYNTDCTNMIVRGITKEEWQASRGISK